MTMPSTINTVKSMLSAARMGTYERVLDEAGNPISLAMALELYAWNAQVSAAFLTPLHICEVVTRNAVAEVLEKQYGNRWPWSHGFEQSRPVSQRGYCLTADLQSARRRGQTTGKVIPELKFVFWQKMFTARNDVRLWNPYLMQAFPNLPQGQSVSQSRHLIYNDLEHIRILRNRIAHHEPIFSRNLLDDFQKITDLIGIRCAVTAQWMSMNQQVLALIAARPDLLAICQN